MGEMGEKPYLGFSRYRRAWSPAAVEGEVGGVEGEEVPARCDLDAVVAPAHSELTEELRAWEVL